MGIKLEIETPILDSDITMLRQIVDILGGSNASTPTPAPAAKKAAAPKPKAAPAPEPEPEPEEDDPLGDDITPADLLARAKEFVIAGRTAEVKEILEEFGYDKVSNVKGADVAAIHERLGASL